MKNFFSFVAKGLGIIAGVSAAFFFHAAVDRSNGDISFWGDHKISSVLAQGGGKDCECSGGGDGGGSADGCGCEGCGGS